MGWSCTTSTIGIAVASKWFPLTRSAYAIIFLLTYIYRGEALVTEVPLLDVPVALCTFYSDSHVPRTPAVAVASGSYVFIYRNLRPFYKFSLPNVVIDPNEVEVWNKLKSGDMSVDAALDATIQLRDRGVKLSRRSIELINIEDPAKKAELVDKYVYMSLLHICFSIHSLSV